MKTAMLFAVPCTIALLIGGMLLWLATPADSLPQAQTNLSDVSHSNDAAEQMADALQERYRTFLSTQNNLTIPTEITLASLQTLFDEREQLRQRNFTPIEQDQLFAEDRLMEQLTLRRQAMVEASDVDKQLLESELDLWLAEQPDWFREAETNGRLLGELQGLAQVDPAKRDALLIETGGPEAVDRVHQLEQNRQKFNEQLTGFLAELKQLPNEARAEQQQELLARWFEPEQWRRVQALTRITLDEPSSK